MKVSQEGIEWVKKKPKVVRDVRWWFDQEGGNRGCPLTRQNYREPWKCKNLCFRIWPELKEISRFLASMHCPCNQIDFSKVIQIAKQIVGEEVTNVREISTE